MRNLVRKKNSNYLAENRKARHDYFVEETIEAGLALVGTEVKSIRNGKCNLKDSYAGFKVGECYIFSMHISPYEHGNIFNKDPLRDRKLLLTKRELNKLFGKVKQDGYSLVPISLYFKGSLVKLKNCMTNVKILPKKMQNVECKKQCALTKNNYKVRGALFCALITSTH